MLEWAAYLWVYISMVYARRDWREGLRDQYTDTASPYRAKF